MIRRAATPATEGSSVQRLCHDLEMSPSFVVDVWSDVVCPFCYLGARQLASAMAEFEHAAEVTLRHRAFELDPHAAMSHDRSLVELVADKYSMPVSSVQSMHERLESQARELGMIWSLATALPTNTFDAHRVIALASSLGVGDEASERLFRAYFSEGRLVSDREVLSELAHDVGVNADDLWRSDAFTDVVRSDEREAQELGISGVPSFLMDSKFMVTGAQGAAHILDVLRRAWARRAA
jgi:predicted DsbA family dithiol-disulfide isomerase